MYERIMKLYVTAMMGDVRSPMPHLVGPPGCGKSSVVQQLADVLKVNLFILNVSRLSPMEVEGVQMPVSPKDKDMHLKMLTATFWTDLREGDILLLDEFLRGFPEVYNALLDILTSRRVGNYRLPKVFIIGASNSTVSYDKALEDRLLHIPVEDPRGSNPKAVQARDVMANLFVNQLGLLPHMTTSTEMSQMLETEVLPMFDILDKFNGRGSGTSVSAQGHSLRNLIGQVQLREIQSPQVLELLDINNRQAMRDNKWQYVVLPHGVQPNTTYRDKARLLPAEKLTPVQLLNRNINLQLIEAEELREFKTKGGTIDDDIFAN